MRYFKSPRNVGADYEDWANLREAAKRKSGLTSRNMASSGLSVKDSAADARTFRGMAEKENDAIDIFAMLGGSRWGSEVDRIDHVDEKKRLVGGNKRFGSLCISK